MFLEQLLFSSDYQRRGAVPYACRGSLHVVSEAFVEYRRPCDEGCGLEFVAVGSRVPCAHVHEADACLR